MNTAVRFDESACWAIWQKQPLQHPPSPQRSNAQSQSCEFWNSEARLSQPFAKTEKQPTSPAHPWHTGSSSHCTTPWKDAGNGRRRHPHKCDQIEQRKSQHHLPQNTILANPSAPEESRRRTHPTPWTPAASNGRLDGQRGRAAWRREWAGCKPNQLEGGPVTLDGFVDVLHCFTFWPK